jgi:TPR repeat/Tetratricopeptide repeat
MNPSLRLPPESVLEVDYRRAFDQLPDEIVGLLPLFDGRRTLAEVIRETRLGRETAVELVNTLHARRLIATPAPVAEGPELTEWLAQPLRPTARRSYRRVLQLAVGAAGVAAAFGLAYALVPRQSVDQPRPVAVEASTSIAVAAPAPVVEAPKAVEAPPPVVEAPPPVVAAPPPPVVEAPKVVAAPPPVEAPPVAAPPAPAAPDYASLVGDGRRLYAKGRLKPAIASLEQALAVEPDGDEALVLLARAHLDQGANQKALTESQRALAKNARSADAWLVVGTVQQQNGKNGEARAAYQHYVELAPKGPFASEIRSILKTLH